MKILIVEDDFTSRLMMQKMLNKYGETHVAVDGKEALEAFNLAWAEEAPYDLVCLDIMMPEMDGQAALKEIRKIEDEKGISGLNGVKVIMTTAVSDKKNILEAFRAQCEAYLIKPIDRGKLEEQLRSLGLVK